MIEIKPTTTKKVWIGKFVDLVGENKEEEFAFRIDAELDENQKFKGTVWEEEFYEHTKMFVEVFGSITEDHISFVKFYPCLYEIDENFKTIIDHSQKGHTVIYDANWDKISSKWIGDWLVKGDLVITEDESYQADDYGGYFEMEAVE